MVNVVKIWCLMHHLMQVTIIVWRWNIKEIGELPLSFSYRKIRMKNGCLYNLISAPGKGPFLQLSWLSKLVLGKTVAMLACCLDLNSPESCNLSLILWEVISTYQCKGLGQDILLYWSPNVISYILKGHSMFEIFENIDERNWPHCLCTTPLWITLEKLKTLRGGH